MVEEKALNCARETRVDEPLGGCREQSPRALADGAKCLVILISAGDAANTALAPSCVYIAYFKPHAYLALTSDTRSCGLNQLGGAFFSPIEF